MSETHEVRVLACIDRSGSMGNDGKWEAVCDGLRTIAHENKGVPAQIRRVFFDVNRSVDKKFLPIDEAADRIPPRSDARTAFFDAARRGLDYLMEELELYPESSRPIGQLILLTDGLDNESGQHSKRSLARQLKWSLKEQLDKVDGDLTRSPLMIIYWAFGDGSREDRRRHNRLAAELGIPSEWTRYSKGSAEEIRRATHSLSRTIRSAGTVGKTEMF